MSSAANAIGARRGGPRAVPLHLNGVEIGIVREPADRPVEDQAFEQLCLFAVQLFEPAPAADLEHRRRCADRLLRALGAGDPRAAAVLGHLRMRRGADHGLIAAAWRFEPGGTGSASWRSDQAGDAV